MSKKGRSATEVRRLKAELRAGMALGESEVQLMDRLSVGAGDLRWLKSQLMQDELAEVINDSPAEVWLKYRMRMDGIIGDLDAVIEKGKSGKVGGSLNAAVGAIKAKAQIVDKVLERGQDLGVIHREPEKSVTIGGVAVTDLREGELEELVVEKREALALLLERYAVTDYAAEDDEDPYETEGLPAPTPRRPRRRKVT